MTRFVDEYLDRKVVGYPVEVVPQFSTQITQVDSGAEQANRRWLHPLRQISIPSGVRDIETFEAFKSHWHIMGGPFHTFPWRDPTDFASCDLTRINEVPTLARTDSYFATGDGVTVEFQLSKRYTVGSNTYDRPIYRPITSTVLIGMDGAAPGAFSPPFTNPTVSRNGGTVLFAAAPPLGVELTWGGLFDLEVRYESDDTFSGIMRTFNAAGFADIPLQEVRFCND